MIGFVLWKCELQNSIYIVGEGGLGLHMFVQCVAWAQIVITRKTRRSLANSKLSFIATFLTEISTVSNIHNLRLFPITMQALAHMCSTFPLRLHVSFYSRGIMMVLTRLVEHLQIGVHVETASTIDIYHNSVPGKNQNTTYNMTTWHCCKNLLGTYYYCYRYNTKVSTWFGIPIDWESSNVRLSSNLIWNGITWIDTSFLFQCHQYRLSQKRQLEESRSSQCR